MSLADPFDPPLEEYGKFAKFTDSLLARSTKLSDLIGQLESCLTETNKTQDSIEGKRVEKSGAEALKQESYGYKGFDSFKAWLNPLMLALRSVQSLENACNILTAQFEACEVTKMDTSDLKKAGINEHTKNEQLGRHYN